jgi:hypothetical protein
MENIFQFIFYYTTKHQKIIYFLKIYFLKKNKYFPEKKKKTSNFLKHASIPHRHGKVIKYIVDEPHSQGNIRLENGKRTCMAVKDI